MSEYRQYLNAVGRCGYFDSYPNGQNGAPVEKMAIFPTVGGMENLKELAKSNGVRFEVEAKKLDGIYQECITFVRRDHVDFATKAASCYKIGKIKDGASKSFDLYIENFVEEKKNITWPKNRMLQTEWDTLNKLLEPFKLGVRDFGGRMTLVNYGAVQEKQDLRSKASKNFEQYLDLLLTSGESRGLPSFRMSDDEWQKLNEELKPRGVKLEKVDGYMWFRKIVTQKDLARATDNLKEKLFKELKAKYPNIPDKNLRTIVELDDADAIYYYLRHVMPGDEYLHPTAEEYESAKMWHRGHGVAGGVESVVYDNYNWYCRRYVAPDREPRPNRQGEGFHMSLNVNLTDGTLRNLDKVLEWIKVIV